MSFGTTPPRNDYVGNGAVVTYSYGFRIFAYTDLKVTVRNTSNVETTLVYPTDFSATGVNVAAGGTITILKASLLTGGFLTTGYALTIRFSETTNQPVDLRNQGGFFMEVVEDLFDRVVRFVQQVEDIVNRSLHLPETEVGTATLTTLPVAADRASKLLGFDASGNPIATGGGLTSPPVTAFAVTLLDDTTAAAARATLGSTTVGDAVFIAASAAAARATLGAVDVTLIDAAGDLLVGSAADTAVRKAVGAGGTVLMSRAAASDKLAYVAALNSVIYGLTYANNAGDATNDLDIAAGGAMDATGAYFMVGSALTKQSDAVWAVGSAAGGLDTGAVGNSDYYIWLIARSDTGVVDVLFSLSSTAPTMPTNYDFKRLIGWFKRVGGTIVAFKTYETEGGGLEMKWDVPTLDINLAATLTTARRTDAVKVPLNFSVIAWLRVVVTEAATEALVVICCPDEADAAPSITVAPLANVSRNVGATTGSADLLVRTSAAGLIAARSNLSTVDVYAVVTLGFTWARRV